MADTSVEVGNDGGEITIRLDGNVPAISVVDQTGEVAVRITTRPPPGWTPDSHGPGLFAAQQQGSGLLGTGVLQQDSSAFASAVESADTPKPRIDLNGQTGTITLGGIVEEPTSDLVNPNPRSEQAAGVTPTVRKLRVRIALLGEEGSVHVGGNDVVGEIVVADDTGDPTARIQGTGHASFGGAGRNGRVALVRSSGGETVRMNAEGGDIILGGHGVNGDLKILGTSGDLRVHIKGADGDIILSNADFAEDFDVAEPIEAGTVVVLDETRGVRPSDRAYDSAVVGVIAGAGGCRPAIVADRVSGAAGRQAVSLLGKAYCKVEADQAPVAIGDLLTTSTVLGHAMKVQNRGNAIGALLGKALAPLPAGRALVPILVMGR